MSSFISLLRQAFHLVAESRSIDSSVVEICLEAVEREDIKNSNEFKAAVQSIGV